MELVILLCVALSCDRIVLPVEKCGSESYLMFQVEVLLAQTGLYDGSQKIHVACVKKGQ